MRWFRSLFLWLSGVTGRFLSSVLDRVQASGIERDVWEWMLVEAEVLVARLERDPSMKGAEKQRAVRRELQAKLALKGKRLADDLVDTAVVLALQEVRRGQEAARSGGAR